jgi:hypothetical protein
MTRWSLPHLRPVRRRAELEDLFARPRDKDPDAQSLAILVAALQKTLDRQEIWTGSAGSTVAPSPFRAYPLAHLV